MSKWKDYSREIDHFLTTQRKLTHENPSFFRNEDMTTS